MNHDVRKQLANVQGLDYLGRTMPEGYTEEIHQKITTSLAEFERATRVMNEKLQELQAIIDGLEE